MRPSMRNALLWQALSLLLTFAGLLISALVIVGVFLGPPENSLSNMSEADITLVVLGVVMLSAGRLIGWKFGLGIGVVSGFRDQSPEQSRLEQLGYRIPPEAEETGDSEFAYEDGDLQVICQECGTKNEGGFSYCRDCSAELPE